MLNNTDYESNGTYFSDMRKAVANEVHLENDNLVTLPEALTRFYKGLVYNSQNFLQQLESTEVHLPSQDQQQLTALISGVNSVLAEIIDKGEENPDTTAVLRKFTIAQALQEKKKKMMSMEAGSVIVKSKEFPSMGTVKEENGHATVYLNQNLLHDPDQLVATYTHEQAHFLSGEGDYKLDFQRFLMMVALSKGKSSNP